MSCRSGNSMSASIMLIGGPTTPSGDREVGIGRYGPYGTPWTCGTVKAIQIVSVISVIHRHNILALNELSEALRRWGVDRWMPAHLEAAVNYRDLALTYDDLEKLNVARECSPKFDKALGTAFAVGHVPPSLIVEGMWPEEMVPRNCSTLGRLLIIHPSGNVYACYASEYSEVGLVDKISGPEFAPFSEMLTRASRITPDLCKGCPEPVQHSNKLR